MPTVLGKLHSSFTAPHPFWSFCPTRLVLFARYASWGHGSSGKCCSPLFHRVPCLFRGRDARKQKTHRDLAGTLHLKRHATRAGVARVPGNTYDPYLTPPPGKKGDVDAGDLSEIGGTTGSFPPLLALSSLSLRQLFHSRPVRSSSPRVYRAADEAAMDAIALVQFIYEAGNDLVERCKSVKQCHSEATSIAIRTVRTLGDLEGASSEFSGSVPISAALNDLKGTLIQANELVKVLR